MEDDGTTDPDRPAALAARGDHRAAAEALDALADAEPEQRKRAIQGLRDRAADHPDDVTPLLPALSPYLEDGDRAVRLATAKLHVAIAAGAPDAGRAAVAPLADRLADDQEFYYVRARCAEALGYVALEHPDAVDAPAVLADLRIGLRFDAPEVREKLATALAYVAIGAPARLRHHVGDLAGHCDDDAALVRYHLATALAAVGCGDPAWLAPAREALVARLDDDCPQVRGRAAEALAVLAAGDGGDDRDGALPADRLEELCEGNEAFVRRRARAALRAAEVGPDPDDNVGEDAGDDKGDDGADGDAVGTLDGLRATVEDAADAVEAPDGEGACRHCGLPLPAGGPPICPGCGAPR